MFGGQQGTNSLFGKLATKGKNQAFNPVFPIGTALLNNQVINEGKLLLLKKCLN